MYDTIEQAEAALEAAISDATSDNPEVGADDIGHDMVVAVAFECTDAVALELCRTQIGCVPFDLRARLGDTDWLRDEF